MVDHQSHSVFNHDKLRLKLFVYINIYLLIVCHKRGPDAFRYESKMPHSATFWYFVVSKVLHSYMAPFIYYMGHIWGNAVRRIRVQFWKNPLESDLTKARLSMWGTNFQIIWKKHENFKPIIFGALNSKLNYFLCRYN